VTDDRRDSSAFISAIEGLRTEISGLRDDVREDIKEIREDLERAVTNYAITHGHEHQAERDDSRAAHDRFDTFIRNAELAQARRDGAIGIFRFVIETLARYARPIATVLLGLAALIAAGSGAIQIQVGQ